MCHFPISQTHRISIHWSFPFLSVISTFLHLADTFIKNHLQCLSHCLSHCCFLLTLDGNNMLIPLASCQTSSACLSFLFSCLQVLFLSFTADLLSSCTLCENHRGTVTLPHFIVWGCNMWSANQCTAVVYFRYVSVLYKNNCSHNLFIGYIPKVISMKKVWGKICRFFKCIFFLQHVMQDSKQYKLFKTCQAVYIREMLPPPAVWEQNILRWFGTVFVL